MMQDLTGNMVLFGSNLLGIALDQLVLLLCVVVLIFLFILEVEFRQVRKVARKMDDDELTMTRELRELRDSVRDLGIVLKEDYGFEVGEEKESGSERQEKDAKGNSNPRDN
jgi:hypothetical protein